MKTSFNAGLVSTALAVTGLAVTGLASPLLAADLGRSMKDGYAAPVHVRGPAGPCYIRGDVGYSVSRDPTVRFPVTTDTYTTNIYDNGGTSAFDANGNSIFIPNSPTYEYLYNGTYQGDTVSSTSMENNFFGGFGLGCGSGSRGLRGEVMFNYHGTRNIDGEPLVYSQTYITNDYTTGQTSTTGSGNIDDPLHTSLKTYTLMFNGYYDLGKFHTVTPYIGAGVGVAYNRLGETYFTGNPYLPNRLEGDGRIALAWSLMAGIGWQVSDRAIIDIGYRYLDMGKAQSGRVDSAGAVNPRVTIDDIAAHEFKVGLRYHFGGGDCCAYAPMK